MKKFTSRKTGEVIYGKFGEATKFLKQKGYDWQLIQESGSRLLFSTLEEFIEQYQEDLNPFYVEIKQVFEKHFLPKMNLNKND